MSNQEKPRNADGNPGLWHEMPVVPYKVLYTDIPFYRDEECLRQDPEGKIMIIEAQDPDDPIYELDIVPIRNRYEVGQYLRFRTNQHKMWEKSWFQNPITGNIEVAWRVVAAEFVGEVLSEKTLADHKEQLEGLESRMCARRPSPAEPAPVN